MGQLFPICRMAAGGKVEGNFKQPFKYDLREDTYKSKLDDLKEQKAKADKEPEEDLEEEQNETSSAHKVMTQKLREALSSSTNDSIDSDESRAYRGCKVRQLCTGRDSTGILDMRSSIHLFSRSSFSL